MNFFDKLFNREFKTNLNLLLENENYKNLISGTEYISIGFSEIFIFKAENLKKEQIGYSFTRYGKSLTGFEIGDWKKNWIVIGRDDMDDPIFIDYEKPNFPVFISEHGKGSWEENYIAITLENFVEILKDLEKLSINRKNPVQIEKNPISEIELNLFLAKTKTENKEMDVEYWKMFLDNH